MKNSYFLIPNSIFENHELSIHAKVLYAVLKRFSNRNNTCYPGRKTIADCGGFGITTYKKSVKELVKHGYIKKLERFRSSRGQTSNLFVTKACSKRFFKVRADIFDFSFSAYELVVYFYLCKCGAEKGCFPAQKQIARDCDISVPRVGRAIKILQKMGIITAHKQQRTDGANTTLFYVLCDNTIHTQDKKADTVPNVTDGMGSSAVLVKKYHHIYMNVIEEVRQLPFMIRQSVKNYCVSLCPSL